MDITEAAFANFLGNAIFVKDGAVIKLFSCTENINTIEV